MEFFNNITRLKLTTILKRNPFCSINFINPLQVFFMEFVNGLRKPIFTNIYKWKFSNNYSYNGAFFLT